jgi:chorismate mutase
MVEHVIYEYTLVASQLGVDPELLLKLHRAGQLPATKVGKRASILIADRDLVPVLRHCFMAKAAKQLNLNQFLEPVTPELEKLSEAILVYLERRYGNGPAVDTAKQVANQLLPRRESRSSRIVNRLEEERRNELLKQIFTLLLSRMDPRANLCETNPAVTNLPEAA